jgi:hypothetical protein
MYSEVYNLPVSYKRWFVDRIIKELSKGNKGEGDEGASAPTRALHQDSPDIRGMQGRARTHAPSRLRRFT